MEFFVTRKEITWQKKPLLLRVLAALTVNSMLFVVLFVDLATWIYQEIYFSIMNIPKIKRSKYVQINRHKLQGLTLIQKWSCGYCEYVNSVLAWVKAVVNQTEVYSCSIKYSHQFPRQEYQAEFYEPKIFEKAE